VHQQVGDFLEFAVVGDVEDVVAAVVQVVAGAADGAQGGVAGGDAGQGDGFLGLGEPLKWRSIANEILLICKFCEYSRQDNPHASRKTSDMKKTFMGIRLRRFREERGLTQVALARALELSPSYLNQLEQNQRPLSVPVLLKLNAVFGVDVQQFSEDDEARLIADLREVFLSAPGETPVSTAEIRELAANMPAVARTLIALDRGLRDQRERTEALSIRLGDDRSGTFSAGPHAL
jgi:transcriptional regulator with XRE-family HTH domain